MKWLEGRVRYRRGDKEDEVDERVEGRHEEREYDLPCEANEESKVVDRISNDV